MIGYTKGRMRLCSALLIMNLLFIWGNSLMPASVSSAFSRWVGDIISLIFMGGAVAPGGNGLLRKIAHFSEFGCLGVCLSWLTGMRMRNFIKSVTLALACGCAAACVDEALQYLSPGRGPRLADVGIDTAGVAAGITLLWIGYNIYQKLKNKSGGKQQ